jgi:hypothetical protein
MIKINYFKNKYFIEKMKEDLDTMIDVPDGFDAPLFFWSR